MYPVYSNSWRSPANIDVPPMKTGTFNGTAAPVVEEALVPLLVAVELPGFALLPEHVTEPLTTWLVLRALIGPQSKLAEV